MNPTINLKVCPSCEFASEAAGNFCSNCGAAFDGSSSPKYKTQQAGNGFHRDEYGWQRGAPAGDPRYSPQAEAFWANHRVIEDESGDALTGFIGVLGVGLAIYGVCKLIEKASENDKLLNKA